MKIPNAPRLSFLAQKRAVSLGILFFLWGSVLLAQWGTVGSNGIKNTNTGNVGIATGDTAPSAQLEVQGSSVLRVGNFYLNSNVVSANSFQRFSLGYGAYWNDAAGDYTITDPTYNRQTFSGENGTFVWTSHAGALSSPQSYSQWHAFDRMVLTSSGNLGIGTTAPTQVLDVTGSSSPSIAIFDNSAAVVGKGGELLLQHQNGVGARTTYGAVKGYALGGGSGIESGAVVFKTMQAGTLTEQVRIDGNGNVGIGTASPAARLGVIGDISASGTISGGTILAKYQDIAEWVLSTKPIPPGSVVILDPQRNNAVIPSFASYDTRVAGVVSGTPGIILGESAADKVKIATTGRVLVHVDATTAPIRIGDLLVTSDKQGVAMRSQPIDVAGRKIHQPGTLIGKALEALDGGEGEILVLLSLQ
jgi:hypothetical protein